MLALDRRLLVAVGDLDAPRLALLRQRHVDRQHPVTDEGG
jgi:hypothetical protein